MSDFPVKKIKSYLSDCDYIFGLGDYNTQKGLNYLYGLGKEVIAVSGNMDDQITKIQLPPMMKTQIEGVNIGLIHGWGAKSGLRNKIFKEFSGVDLICYGHTHSAFFEKEHGIYFFNPGSLCGHSASFGILTIDSKNITAEIIPI